MPQPKAVGILNIRQAAGLPVQQPLLHTPMSKHVMVLFLFSTSVNVFIALMPVDCVTHVSGHKKHTEYL